MGFFDLSIPYNEPPRSGGKEIAGGKTLRLKLATKAMELGYVGIAHNRSIKGVMSDKDSCTIPLLTLGSLIKVAPRLASSVGFHRDLLGVPRTTPFRQYTRLTVHVESNAQCQSLNSGNPILKSYDIIAVRPMNQNAFDYACEKAEVDLISIDFTDKMLFRLKHPMVKAAIQRGIYFEIKYSDILMDAQTRRQVISNAKLLVDWTRGKNLIISSGAPSVTELRGPNDVINLMFLLGLSAERARAAISKNCRNMIAKVLKKKRFHKEAVRVELLSAGDTFSLEQPLSEDCMKWDRLSSGEGDMLLDDLAKAFDATNVVAHKSSKAIDFTSVLDGLPKHGFRVKDIVGTESVTQPSAAKVIDTQVHSSNQVSELRMATASSDDNLREIETISQIDMLMSEDDNKVEPTTNVLKEEAFALRKCSASHGQGILVQNQTATPFTLTRCTKSEAASDVSMNIESTSEGGSMSPSKSDHGIPQSPVEVNNMGNAAFEEEASVDENSKERATTGHASNDEMHITESGHHASIDDEKHIPEPEHLTSIADEMKIDCSSEANHDEYMEVTMEDQMHETVQMRLCKTMTKHQD
ncbi:Polymerase/histidinol phosphatase-like protein [Arabidopsis thaliana]|jgi:ribonuclease P/MRP protein subunit RPP1|uniref:Protein GAMETOPHYTE DEFECTIVE 1 n=1 Tax=Arabidopsis thaliana TaxID=3702 RepID=GAF1_ARATH|nr:Polymerase/histidinol phosphatase-like protein [Arabidopsis thaliana]F4JXF1.1 RecName: Full=Protein GAMETOPHYTE DEFECTIVE 1; AltName: Full=Probable ribonuclease P protein subunit p30; Short=AtRPP30; Short=RNaseP protein p30 [Arabidopsis thaliana]AED97261.1 Polymerase/histidinol phosphatase-like protein [Arabidopsis thaliana]|eukprot:NP_200806.2 Polymerase/histidinol phosphatase-like protein [Arabidopsis thaliana]